MHHCEESFTLEDSIQFNLCVEEMTEDTGGWKIELNLRIYENESGEGERHQDRSSISFIVTARMLIQLAAAGWLVE